MEYINIVYESDCNDADIIAIPDVIYCCIYTIAQDFINWLVSSESNIILTSEGKQVINCETIGFIDWLNSYVLHDSIEKAFIVSEHVIANDDYITVDF